MADTPDFRLQPNFPVAAIAQLIAEKGYKEAQMRNLNNQQFNTGMQTLGAGLSDVVNRRNAMAQALAQAKIFSQTPEGQQILGTSPVTSGPAGPVLKNQTAQGTDASGNILPTPIPNKSPVSIPDVQTAFMGEQPGNFMKNLTEQSNLRRLYEQMTQNNNFRNASLSETGSFHRALTGVRFAEIGQQDTNSLTSRLSSLTSANDQLSQKLGGRADALMGQIAGLNPTEQAISDQYQSNIAEAQAIKQELSKRRTPGFGGTNPPKGTPANSYKTPQGISYTVKQYHGYDRGLSS